MSSRGLPRESVDRLASQVLDAGLSDEQRAELLSGIRDDPDACDRFVDQMMLHATLQLELGAYRPPTLSDTLYGIRSLASNEGDAGSLPGDAAALPTTLHSGRISHLSRVWLYCSASLAVGIAIAFLGHWLLDRSRFPERRLAGTSTGDWNAWVGPPEGATPVAYLAVANGCEWGDGGLEAWTVGRSIALGEELTLYEGTAVFRLSSGVTLNVEGPAALLLASPTSLVLQHGKLTALVPWTVSDFRLLAATCRISARDAEFGVDVDGSSVDVHVFSGEVRAAASPFFNRPPIGSPADDPLRPDSPVVQPETIHEDESVLFSIDGSAAERRQRGEADRGRFATKLSMSGRLAITSQYVEAIRAAKPRGYWRFESIRDGRVPNEIEGGLPPLQTFGDVTLVGDASNRVLEFGPHASGTLVSSERMDCLAGHEYSVEVWAKPSHFHFGMLVTMTTGPENVADRGQWFNEKHGFMLEAQPGYQCEYGNPGSIRFLHRDPPGSYRTTGTSCYSNTLYGLRRWQHIVAVKDRESMRLYIDGQLVGQEEDDTPLADSLLLVVGQHLSDNSGLNRFVGQLDELAIYDRTLTEEEIVEHWQVVDSNEPNEPNAPGI